MRGCIAFVLVVGPAVSAAAEGVDLHPELMPPVQVQADGAPIDVARQGHAAPFVGDIDGDGLRDLLVGEFFEGRLRVFHNRGSETQPSFQEFDWFRAGADLARIPEG